MGRWIQRYDRAEIKGIFWRNYLLAIIFNWVALLTCSSVKYYNENKNKAKRIGTLLGFIVSLMVYGIFITVVAKAYIILLLLGLIGIPASILLTILIYTKEVNKLAQKDIMDNKLHTLLILEELMQDNIISK